MDIKFTKYPSGYVKAANSAKSNSIVWDWTIALEDENEE